MSSKLLRAAIISSLLYVVALSPAQAIPSFAKTYKMTCASCHAYYPRLNDFGEQFRRNGYQLPGKTKLMTAQSTFPASVEVVSAYTSRSEGTARSTSTGYIVSGGAVAKDVSVFLQYPAYFGASDDITGPPDRLQRASVLFTNLARSGVNVRAGRFTPAYYAFGTTYHLISNDLTANLLGPGVYSDGVEISKFGAGGMSYYVGHAEWALPNVYSRPMRGYYGRVAKSFRGGLGETKGHSIGLTGFWGQIGEEQWTQAGPYGGRFVMMDQPTRQISADASLTFGRFNLSLQRAEDVFEASDSLPRIEAWDTLAELAYSASSKWVWALGFDGNAYDISPSRHSQTDEYALRARYYPSKNIGMSASYTLWREPEQSAYGVGEVDYTGHWMELGLDLCY